MRERIGIIGQGFVGNAVNEGFKDNFEIETFDLDQSKSTCASLQELVIKSSVGYGTGTNGSGIIFLCVPTPMKKDGSCDTSIVENVLNKVNEIVSHVNYAHFNPLPIIILKSTVPPTTCEKLAEKYQHILLVFNPEFLTEANAVGDFKNQEVIHIGLRATNYAQTITETITAKKISEVFSKQFPNAIIKFSTYTEAEMIKYVANCFLALKVTFANQIHSLCSKLPNVSYDQVADLAKMDVRLGETHWKVPGPDGDLGYGGHCFPKDMAAIAYLADVVGANLTLVEEAIKYNNSVRTDRNWEAMIGRAVAIEE